MKITSLFLALAVGTTSVTAIADNEYDAKQIRHLVKQGKVMPLDVLLKKYQPLAQGRLLDLEVEHERDRIIYELEFLRPNGEVVEYKIDARNGDLLEREID